MSDTAAVILALCIFGAGYWVAHGLDSIGDAIRKLAEKR